LDDRIVEVDWQGNILWSWHPHEHFDDLGFDDAAKASLRKDPNLRAPGTGALGATAAEGVGDWLHINSLSALGPNRHYDAGDQRFHPDNLIWDAREANIIAIVSKQTGKIVWKLGPRYDGTDAEKKLGWIIGQHHAHLIPKGLPGAGNLLVFDNGGWAGYGTPTPGAPNGLKIAQRDYSRVLEIDPTTLQQRATVAQRQHLDHRGLGRAHLRGNAQSRDRLGVHQPVLAPGPAQLELGVPRLPRAL
jgi:hypothetical protein